MPKEHPAQAVTNLNDYIAALRRGKWIIILVTGLVVGTALFFSYRQTPVYTATSRVLVRPTGSDAKAYYDINLDTERGLAQSTAVAALVKEQLSLDDAATALLANVAVSVEPNTEILAVDYSSPDPALAQRYADAFAEGYLEFRRQQALDDYEIDATDLRGRVAALNADRRAISQRLSAATNDQTRATLTTELTTIGTRIGILEEQLAELGSPESLKRSGGEIVEPATLPTSPSSPNHLRDGLLALFIGLALGAGVAFMRERFDERLVGSSDLERQLGAPVLATIPKVDAWRKRDKEDLITMREPKSATSEAYRALRTNLRFLADRHDIHLLSVTSPHPGEGKTTTVANLAVVLSQTGQRVIAVSCDLRRPRLHRFFGCENTVGLSDILLGRASLPEVIQAPTDLPRVRILASGPVPPNPAELLGSGRMDRLLDDLRSVADYVLIDTPPLLAVADSLVLGPKGDGILVVVDAGSTARGAAESVAEKLKQVDGHIVGGVFNNFDPAKARYYSSDYRTYYPRAYEEEHPATASVKGNGHAEWTPDDIWEQEPSPPVERPEPAG